MLSKQWNQSYPCVSQFKFYIWNTFNNINAGLGSCKPYLYFNLNYFRLTSVSIFYEKKVYKTDGQQLHQYQQQRSTTSHIKPLNTNKPHIPHNMALGIQVLTWDSHKHVTTQYGIGNPGADLGQSQTCDHIIWHWESRCWLGTVTNMWLSY